MPNVGWLESNEVDNHCSRDLARCVKCSATTPWEGKWSSRGIISGHNVQTLVLIEVSGVEFEGKWIVQESFRLHKYMIRKQPSLSFRSQVKFETLAGKYCYLSTELGAIEKNCLFFTATFRGETDFKYLYILLKCC